jgi:alcohol dehydrogenase
VSAPAPDPVRRDVRYGDGAICELPSLIEELGARRVLLVTGRRSFEASGAARVVPTLRTTAEIRRWSGFAPNTDVADLAAGLEIVAEFGPDLLVGVGGGSAMDMTKLLRAFRGTSDQALLIEAIRAGTSIDRRPLALVLVPTTSGSGSEATHFAVVYIGDEKFSVGDRSLLPDRVILDPQLARSGSPYQRATSGIDAVTQAIESLWATGASDRSRGFARHALRLLLEHVEPFVDAATPTSARGMAIGSHLAGRAIDISRTTAAHAMSYAITKGYGVSHGHAVALTLGPLIAANAAAGADRLRPEVDPAVHEQVMHEIVARLGGNGPQDAHRRFVDLLVRVGLEPRLSEAAGARTAGEREALVAAVNVERLGNHPVTLGAAELAAVLEAAG